MLRRQKWRYLNLDEAHIYPSAFVVHMAEPEMTVYEARRMLKHCAQPWPCRRMPRCCGGRSGATCSWTRHHFRWSRIHA